MLDFDIVFFGIQGSGKGTQAVRIAEDFELNIFEMGAELRALSKQESNLGQKINEIVSAGDLVPDEIIMNMVEIFIEKINKDKRILFDGIPRTENQAALLKELLKNNDRTLVGVFIDVSEPEAVKRMLLRKRADDNPETIKKRFDNYKALTIPVIKTFEENNSLITINGDNTINQVTRDIENGLKTYEASSN